MTKEQLRQIEKAIGQPVTIALLEEYKRVHVKGVIKP